MSKPGLFQIHLATLLAGFSGLFGKLLHEGPVVITGGRTIIGCLALFAAAKAGGVALTVRSRRDWLFFAISGAILAAHWLTFFQAIQVSTVAIGLLSFSSFPLFVTFLEPLFFRERLRGLDVLLAAAVVGGLFVVTPSFALGNQMTQGVLWGVTSGLAYAIFSLLGRSHVAHYPAMAVVFYQQMFAGIFLLPGLLFSCPAFSPKTLWLLLLLGVIFTAFAQWMFISSLRAIRAQTASVITLLEPVYAITFAAAMLGEMPSLRTLLGGLMICGAACAATLTHGKTCIAQRTQRTQSS